MIHKGSDANGTIRKNESQVRQKQRCNMDEMMEIDFYRTTLRAIRKAEYYQTLKLHLYLLQGLGQKLHLGPLF